MPACEFKNCGFATTDECETLNETHLYCMACGKVVHLNVHFLDEDVHTGECSCGVMMEDRRRDDRIVCVKFNKDGSVKSVRAV